MHLHRLICVTLFLVINLAYIALVAGEYIDSSAAGAYLIVAVIWSLRLGHYRHRRDRNRNRADS